MICGTCGETKPDDQFTKLNISADKKRGLCKECKKQRDLMCRKRKRQNDGDLKYFKLSPDCLKRDNIRVGVLKLNIFTNRRDNKDFVMNNGLKWILKELDEPYELCEAKSINSYEFILISLTSVMDIENLIYTFEKYAPTEIKPIVIIGGFGVLNIKLIIPYIDIAVFGRAEGQINEILSGEKFDNVWRKAEDPKLQRRYEIRQPQYLLPDEQAVGCRNKCTYCQYTFVRKQISKGEKYNPGMVAQETDWHGLQVDRAGRYNSAWDGFSESSRLKVHKNIKDIDIINKLIEIDNKNINKTVTIKIFNIVGYPWETEQTVLKDIENLKELLAQADSQIKTKINLPLLCTPFGPEPMTPMQYHSADIHTNWNELLSGKMVYKGRHIKCYIIPSVSGSYTLLKRLMIHRCEAYDLDLFKAVVFDRKLKNMAEKYKVPWLVKNGFIKDEIAGEITKAAFDYLYVGAGGMGVAKPTTLVAGTVSGGTTHDFAQS